MFFKTRSRTSRTPRQLIALGLAIAATGTAVLGGAATANANTARTHTAKANTTRTHTARTAKANAAVALPPANGKFDYQLGDAYTPTSGVTVVSRDRTAQPATGLYNICYVNAFQTQPDEVGWWKTNHNDLLLKTSDGSYVIDSGWNEILLDVSTAAKQLAVATIVNGWIDSCAGAGFKAIEPDNLDSYDRSGNRLSRSNALAYARLLTAHAHAKGLAIGQKNTTDVADVGKRTGFDFAIAEECGRYDECGSYTAAYGNQVIVVEYRRGDFTKACNGWGSTLSVVLRNVDVTAPGSGGYVYDAC